MPRIREDVGQDPAQVAATVDAPAEPVGDAVEAPKRSRRPAPEGVTLGLLDAPEPVTELPTGVAGPSGRRGKPVDPRTMQTIAAVQAQPGSWFKIGVYRSAQNPTKDSELGKHGFKFNNVRNEDGTFTRYAMLPVDNDAA